MALQAGAVTVDDNENATGDGLAAAIYTARAATVVPQLPTRDQDVVAMVNGVETVMLTAVQANTVRLATLRGEAANATDLATAIVTYLLANAQVDVSGMFATVRTTDRVGRTPSPNDPNTVIQGPIAPVQLPVGGTARVK